MIIKHIAQVYITNTFSLKDIFVCLSTYTAIILLCKRRKKYAGHNYTDTNAMLRTLDVLKEEEKKTIKMFYANVHSILDRRPSEKE